MVIPWAAAGEDLRTVLEQDLSRRIAVTTVKEAFDRRGWRTIDFVARLRAAADSRAFTTDSLSDVKSQIVQSSGAEVFVQAEVFSKISHSLLSKSPDMASVTTIYSHPQPLAQCAGWLRANMPEAKLVPVESTAAAALRAVKQQKAAAIGHIKLAEMHGLNVLASRIEDLPDNWTRFFIIGPGDTKQENRDKTSILFTLPDKPGSLHGVLAKLAGQSINLTKLESRPLRGEKWKYVFFADLECDLSRDAYKSLLAELRDCAHSLRILGCYPAGPHIDVSEGGEVIKD